jgi:hypothetical protein
MDRIFLFFLDETSGLPCAICFFFKILGSILTQIRLGHRPLETIFLWLYSTEAICQNIFIKSILKMFCELLFYFFSNLLYRILNNWRAKYRFKNVFLKKFKMFNNMAPLIFQKKNYDSNKSLRFDKEDS